MPAAQYDLNVDRGSTTKITLEIEDTAGGPVDLSNYDAEIQVRRSIEDDKMVCRLTTAWPQGCFGPSVAGEFEKDHGVTGYTGGIILNYQGVTGKILIEIDSKSSYWGFQRPRSFYDLRLTNNADNSTTSIIKGEIKSSPTLINTERSPASFAEPPTASVTGATAGTTVSIQSEVIGFPTPTAEYYWIQNGFVIEDANGSHYTPDVGGPLLGHITVTNNEGFSGATVDFGNIIPAIVGSFAPFFNETPTASVVGQTAGFSVTVQNAGATGVPEPSFSYRWTQNGSVIDGAGGQSYTPGNTGPLLANVTISNLLGSTGATVDFGEIIEGPGSSWETFSVARAEIEAVADGGSIDFGPRKFAAEVGDHEAGGINLGSKSITINNGRFSLAKTSNWTDIGGGVYAADHDFSDYMSPYMFIPDENAVTYPLMKVNPAPPSEMDDYRFTYNGNWFTVTDVGVDNGTVQTNLGTGLSGEVEGWTITDNTLKTSVNNLLSGVTMSSTASPWAIIHSANNVTSPARVVNWDGDTGVLQIEAFRPDRSTIKYNESYLHFALCGLPDQSLASGEYVIDLTQGITTGRVLYRPVNGNATDARIPISDYGFKYGSNDSESANVNFNGLTLEGQCSRNSAPGMIRDTGFVNSCTVSNCNFENGAHFFRINSQPITIDRNYMKRTVFRGANLVAGCTLTNNIFDHVENFSAVVVQCRDLVSEIPHTLFTDNVMSLEATTHGQGLSLYKDSWRNATVRHNIFYNCQRAHSYQPGGSGSDNLKRTETHEYKFDNNLVVVDKVLDIQGFKSGQKSVSFNGAADVNVDETQQVKVRHNTVVTTDSIPSAFDMGGRLQLSSIDLRKLQRSSVLVEGNIASFYSASTGGDPNAGHTHSNNLTTKYQNQGALSSTDKLIHPDINDYFNVGTFEGKAVEGGANDGGALGVRWSNIPTSSDIQSIISNRNIDWIDSYPELTIPTVAGSYSTANENTITRGLTGGGVGEFSDWSPVNATYTQTYPVYFSGDSAVGILGDDGYTPGFQLVRTSGGIGPRFTVAFESEATRDAFIGGVSGDHFRLQVTITRGGSGDNVREGGYYAGVTGQVYNYYWGPNTITDIDTVNVGWTAGDLTSASDEWPSDGVTGSRWGDNPLYSLSLQSTPFGTESLFSRVNVLGSETHLNSEDLETNTLYEIETSENEQFTSPSSIQTWNGLGIEFLDFSYTPDRRPLWVSGYATQKTNTDPRNATDAKFISGVMQSNNQPYRKTPVSSASVSDFTSSSTNGRVAWIEDNVKPAIDAGFSRVHMMNINGHTNLDTTTTNSLRNSDSLSNTERSMQPHYPSLVYGAMEFDQFRYYYDDLDSTKSILADTPFTDTGLPNGSTGDVKKAWKYAIQKLRTDYQFTPLEITSYQGYRPVWTDSGMTAYEKGQKKVTSLSQASSAIPTADKSTWGGTSGFAFCPSPGFDQQTDWDVKMAGFWDAEAAGLFSLGFDGIGLDTGGRVEDHGAGRSTGNNAAISGVNAPIAPDGMKSTKIIEVFNNYSMKPMFESVGLSGSGPIDQRYPDADRYNNAGYWAFFGSWWGYRGTVDIDGFGNTVSISDNSYTSTSDDNTPVGAVVIRDETGSNQGHVNAIGSGTGRAPFSNKFSEVHVVVQWNEEKLNRLIEGGTRFGGAVEPGINWIGFRQMLWDMHDAGLIISMGGSSSAVVNDITFEMVSDYIIKLNNGEFPSRPLPDILLGNVSGTLPSYGSGGRQFTGNFLDGPWVTGGTDGRGTLLDNNGVDIGLPLVDSASIKTAFTNSVVDKSLSLVFGDYQTDPALGQTAGQREEDLNALDDKSYIIVSVTDGSNTYISPEMDGTLVTGSRVGYSTIDTNLTSFVTTSNPASPFVQGASIEIKLYQRQSS